MDSDEAEGDLNDPDDQTQSEIINEETTEPSTVPKSDASAVPYVEPQRSPDGITFLNSEPTFEDFLNLKFMHLEFKNITEIDCMQYFTGLESLYLQHNRITDLTGLECLDNLQFLAIQNNLIKDLKGIGHIETLVFLDISYNKIKEYSSEELPPNLFILKMQNNPCEKYVYENTKIFN